MGNQISLEQIDEFKKIYNSEKTNKIIENAITKNGLENACINRDIIIENQPIFNIELPESKRYDQKDSWRCWIFGGLNLIKHNISKNLNMNVIDLELSNNHIAFYDKLEKSNNTYENIIDANNVDFEYIHKDETLKFCVSEGGYWDMFVSIVNKYGIVPYSYNPDTVESTTVQNVEYLYTEKIKKDILKLIELKKNGMDINVLRIEKKKFLQENYILLCKIYGEPTTKFNFEYKDKDGKWLPVRLNEETTTIGYKRLLRFETVVSDGIRIRITDARGPLCINNIGIYDAGQNADISYDVPTEKIESLPFTLTGVAEDDAKLAVDRNNQTTCFVNGNQLIIDLGEEKMISSFHFLPDQSEPNKGLISNYELAVGNTADQINKVVKAGEFSNIRNNPVLQSVYFTPTITRYISLKATRMVNDGEPMGFAEIAVK